MALLAAGSAGATIINGGVISGPAGSTSKKLTLPFTESTPDNTVGKDNFQSDDLFAFEEGQSILISAPINLDRLASTGAAGVLPAGTVVASHYIVFDPVSATLSGFVEFDSDILALISTTGNLAGSDFPVNTGGTYLNPGPRGLEGLDSFTLSSATPKRIELFFDTGSPGDVMRVLTAFSPGGTVAEPATLALLGFGLAGLGLRRRVGPRGTGQASSR